MKRKGALVHSEAQAFDRKPAATAWLKKREAELATPGALETPQAVGLPLSEAVDRHTRESLEEFGRIEAQVLRAVDHHASTASPAPP